MTRLPTRARARALFATLFATAGSVVVLAAACGGLPEGGDCAVKVKCFSADCKTQVADNACICPEGAKTFDQCATPSNDAGGAKDAATDASTDAGTDTGAADAAPKDGSSDAPTNG